ncbi:hypothetical protein CANINC_001572 [Pichia inconspicua]|uniref:Fe2OG dioxygenase domain-containing protein n=1 Tax=Pichia inconspicua TaxID=52247 RepID=A0A4T0X3P0_9ASCO|nr:hypothetical protein CANINC_001572 [[Candida] inconspicua]
MTVLQYPYPETLRSNGLVDTYKDYAPTHAIPQKTRDNEIKTLLQKITSKPGFNPNLKFDPAKHIVFKPEYYKTTKTFTLDDLNIHKTHVPRVTDFGAAYPFPLISEEAVDMILYEALQDDVIDDFARLPNLATGATRLDFHIGGHGSTKAPFTDALSTSKEIAEVVSTFFGTSMQHIFNSECSHLNVSLATSDPVEMQAYPQTDKEVQAKLSAQDAGDGDEIPSTLGLHYDSTTVALVIMLDLPEEAVGGQTTIITGDEKVVRVPEPKKGYATMIQGRILKHLASKPVTNHNRITFVNGFAVTGPELLDNTALTSTKPSVLPRARFDLFYRDWVEYKFKHLEDHLSYVRKQVVDRYENGEGFDQPAFVEKCVEIEAYVRKIYDEMECVNNPPYPPPVFKQPYNDL